MEKKEKAENGGVRVDNVSEQLPSYKVMVLSYDFFGARRHIEHYDKSLAAYSSYTLV